MPFRRGILASTNFHGPLTRTGALMGVGLLLFTTTAFPGAADDTDKKIRMMAEALHAQEQGDFLSAIKQVEALLAISPNDPQLQRLAASLKQHQAEKLAAALSPQPTSATQTTSTVSSGEPSDVQMKEARPTATNGFSLKLAKPRTDPSATQGSTLAQTINGNAPETPPAPNDVEGLLSWENARQQALLAKASELFAHAQKLSLEERFADTLEALGAASSLLPDNPMTRRLLDDIEALRNDVEHRQRVAGFARGNTVPHLSVQYVSMNLDANESGSEEGKTKVSAKIIEMPASMFADLVAAWRVVVAPHFGVSSGTMQWNRSGDRPVYKRGPFQLVTDRQIRLYWLLRECAARVENSQRLATDTSWLGMSGSFDSEKLAKALSELPDCHVLASPSVDIRPGYQARLNLTGGVPGTFPLSPSPSSGIEIGLYPKRRGDFIDLTVNPTVTQYEGRVLEADGSAPVYSRHEMASHISLKPGLTVLMGGLSYRSGRNPVFKGSAWERIPWLGSLHQNKENAADQKEILLLINAE